MVSWQVDSDPRLSFLLCVQQELERQGVQSGHQNGHQKIGSVSFGRYGFELSHHSVTQRDRPRSSSWVRRNPDEKLLPSHPPVAIGKLHYTASRGATGKRNSLTDKSRKLDRESLFI